MIRICCIRLVIAIIFLYWTECWSASYKSYHSAHMRVNAMRYLCNQSRAPKSTHTTPETYDSTNNAWNKFVIAFNDLPSKRRSKLISNSVSKSRSLKKLQQVFCSCPTLVDLFNDSEPHVKNSPLHMLIDRVGLIHKGYLIEMLIRHPVSMASVLMSTKFRSGREQLMMDLSITSSELSPSLNDLIRKIYRQELRRFTRYFISQLNFSQDELKQILLKNPQLLRYSLEKLLINVEFFRNVCDLDTMTIRKMIRLQPSLSAYSLDRKLKPIINFLSNDIHLDNWKRVISRYPQVLSIPISRLKIKANFIANHLKLQRVSDSAALISGFPPLLWLSKGNILQKIQYIQETFNFDDEGLRDIIVTFPQLLGLSVERNLRPKVEYLLDTPPRGAGLTKNELKEMISYQPALLAYSLSKRMKPRVDRMQQHSISLSFSPVYIMSMPNHKFDEWLNLQLSSWTTTDEQA